MGVVNSIRLPNGNESYIESIHDGQMQAEISQLKLDITRRDNDSNILQHQINDILDRLNKTALLVHNCANCGAQLHLEENKPVFHCKYCGSTYIIGAAQVYSHY